MDSEAAWGLDEGVEIAGFRRPCGGYEPRRPIGYLTWDFAVKEARGQLGGRA